MRIHWQAFVKKVKNRREEGDSAWREEHFEFDLVLKGFLDALPGNDLGWIKFRLRMGKVRLWVGYELVASMLLGSQ